MIAGDHQIERWHATGEPFPWLLAYFREIYPHRVDLTPAGVEFVRLTDQKLLVEALHLAYSYDGLHWTPINHNQPIPSASNNRRIRDPFVRRGREGDFHLLSTGGSAATDMFYARSNDLIYWQDQRSVPLMGDVAEARNVWAPEFTFDPEHDNYLVFWSSSSGRYGWDDSRIWCTRTEDFRNFSEPQVLFDPGFTVIDATIVPFEDAFYMFFKDERFGYQHGEHRYIRVATAARLEGPYALLPDAVTPSITEGPAVIRSLEPDRWYLLYDHCMNNCYGVSVSHDLVNWQVVKDTAFPPNAPRERLLRHGNGVVRAARAIPG